MPDIVARYHSRQIPCRGDCVGWRDHKRPLGLVVEVDRNRQQVMIKRDAREVWINMAMLKLFTPKEGFAECQSV